MSQLVFHPIYSQLNLPVKHRFPIDKYQGIYDELLRCGVPAQQFVEPHPVAINVLKQVYELGYVGNIISGALDAKAMRRIGFPWSQQLVQRTLTAVGGALLCAEIALQKGFALNLTGGYHHAFANFGSGFCIFNDLYPNHLKMPASELSQRFHYKAHLKRNVGYLSNKCNTVMEAL